MHQQLHVRQWVPPYFWQCQRSLRFSQLVSSAARSKHAAESTFLLTMQLGYLVVGLAEKIWQSHLRTWWNHPVSGR